MKGCFPLDFEEQLRALRGARPLDPVGHRDAAARAPLLACTLEVPTSSGVANGVHWDAEGVHWDAARERRDAGGVQWNAVEVQWHGEGVHWDATAEVEEGARAAMVYAVLAAFGPAPSDGGLHFERAEEVVRWVQVADETAEGNEVLETLENSFWAMAGSLPELWMEEEEGSLIGE